MNIGYKKNPSTHISTLTFDSPGQSMNVLDRSTLEELEKHVHAIRGDSGIKGVIVTSGKADFIAGADLKLISQIHSGPEARRLADWIKAIFRGLETCGRPVAAVLPGTTLGGGLELAMACHRRIAVDGGKAQFGLPEVSLGLLPGAGGTQRLIRLIGIEKSLPLLVEGKKLGCAEAKALGILDETAPGMTEALAAAEKWLAGGPEASNPWDRKDFKWPGHSPKSPHVAQMFAIGPAMVNAKGGGHYPAPIHILSCVAEGMHLDFERACQVESVYFGLCLESSVSRNMIQSLWFDLNEIKKGARRPHGVETAKFKKAGVIGAGMMGAGIAYSSAAVGMEVVLKDATREQAEKGKAYSAKVTGKLQEKGRMSAADGTALLDRITATGNPGDFAGCDIIVEAVFENRELKAKVTEEAEKAAGGSLLVLSSNTSTLPISGLAEASRQPQHFVGLHFFSPVDRMQLVEIIAGKKTDKETIARAFDYVYQLKKVPILVNDKRGFFTSRCFKTYILEGMALLGEGQDPQVIESAGKAAGMPVGPLALTDELNMELLASIHEQTLTDLKAEGKPPASDFGFATLFKMLKLQRPGRKGGAGYYDYLPDGGKKLWSGLAEAFPAQKAMPVQEMIDRMLFIQTIESARCLEENVVTSAADANIGSIFGWGFPAFHGGVIQFIDSYGIPAFIARAKELEACHGERFKVPAIIVNAAKTGKVG